MKPLPFLIRFSPAFEICITSSPLSPLTAIPVAAGLLVRWGFDVPMSVGAVAMSLSTIIVAANAQLLRGVKLAACGILIALDD